MKIAVASDKDDRWAENLEEGSNSSRKMIMRLKGKRVYVRVMVGWNEDELLDEACEALASKS